MIIIHTYNIPTDNGRELIFKITNNVLHNVKLSRPRRTIKFMTVLISRKRVILSVFYVLLLFPYFFYPNSICIIIFVSR